MIPERPIAPARRDGRPGRRLIRAALPALRCGMALMPAPAAALTVTACDRAAAHPDDPARVTAGLEREEINLPEAEAACRAALAKAPESARAAYQLGRVLFYRGQPAEALPLLERASEAGYAQAIFVLGFLRSLGPKPDFCAAQTLWRRGVALDHPWSAFHLIDKQLGGRFASCTARVSADEMQRFLTIARDRITLTASAGRVEELARRLDAHLEATRR